MQSNYSYQKTTTYTSGGGVQQTTTSSTNSPAILINSGLTDREGAKQVAKRILDTYDRDRNGDFPKNRLAPLCLLRMLQLSAVRDIRLRSRYRQCGRFCASASAEAQAECNSVLQIDLSRTAAGTRQRQRILHHLEHVIPPRHKECRFFRIRSRAGQKHFSAGPGR